MNAKNGKSGKIQAVEVNEEFSKCPACGYASGFHVAFSPEGEGRRLRLMLICPGCGARFDIGRSL